MYEQNTSMVAANEHEQILASGDGGGRLQPR